MIYLVFFILLAKPDRRLVLFYLANDVIQNSRKKGKEFSQSFNKVLGDSMQYLRYVRVLGFYILIFYHIYVLN